jgi:flagellar biosynthesis protein FlhA
MGKFTSMNYQPIILCSPGIRPHLKKLTERFIPTLVVLSHNEIDKRVKLKSLGVASLNHAG